MKLMPGEFAARRQNKKQQPPAAPALKCRRRGLAIHQPEQKLDPGDQTEVTHRKQTASRRTVPLFLDTSRDFGLSARRGKTPPTNATSAPGTQAARKRRGGGDSQQPRHSLPAGTPCRARTTRLATPDAGIQRRVFLSATPRGKAPLKKSQSGVSADT